VRVPHVREADPEGEERRVTVPLELLQARRAEARQLEAELPRDDVEDDDERRDEEDPAGGAGDRLQSRVDAVAQREQRSIARSASSGRAKKRRSAARAAAPSGGRYFK